MITRTDKIPHLDWLNPLKALALLAILFNHLVEEFYSGPMILNQFHQYPIRFLGKLGDYGPGVFILVSGFGLTWAALHRPACEMNPANFFKRRFIRIFPLYIAMHFIFLAGAVFIPDSILRHLNAYPMTLAHPKMLLSILGLRFTDSLFFYLSPAWWFIWLVIQLYLIFPFLYSLMKRIGVKWFLLITCSITLALRLFCAMFPEMLPFKPYYWMMGIFFGTRLAEFCAGMVLALFLMQLKENEQKLPGLAHLIIWSFPIYLLGLACELNWLSKIVSNLLITLGMTGLFYALWEGIIKKTHFLAGTIVWIGIESYSVYLFHHPLLKLTKVLSQQSSELHLLAAVVSLLFSFPVAWLINKVVVNLQLIGKRLNRNEKIRMLSFFVAIGVALSLILVEPRIGIKNRSFSLIIGASIIFLLFAEYASSLREKWPELILRWTIILSSFLKLFAFHSRIGTAVALAIGFVAAIIAKIGHTIFKSKLKAWSVTLIGLGFIVLVSELVLWHFAPLGGGGWGELPALEKHPTRIYSLKPNIVKRLRYNNYDYVVRTNSLGLASPEINTNRPTPDTFRILVIGDAFSMPEGINYKYSFPALIEKKIADYLKPRRVQVINAGVTGYGPVEQYPQLNEIGPLFKPDIVVYQFFINEFQEVNIDAEKRLKSIGLITCFTHGNCKYAKKSQIAQHIGERVFYLLDKITKKPLKWLYRHSFLGYYEKGDNHRYNKDRVEKIRSYLVAMNRVCTDIGAKFVIYYVPSAVAVSKPFNIGYLPRNVNPSDQSIYDLERPFRNLKKIANETGIPVVNLTPSLKQHPKQPVYFPRSWHWNNEGHLVAANVIAKDLLQRGWLDLKTSATRPGLLGPT